MVLSKLRKISDNNTMFPSKGIVDYMGETSRLLTSIRMDGDPSLNTFNSPFQTPVANRSSSSTDTSPDSFFSTPFLSSHLTDLQNQQRLYNRPAREPSTFYDSPSNIFDSGITNYDNIQYNTGLFNDRNSHFDSQIFDQRQLSDTPLQARRQRPIIGRKIYGSQSGLLINDPIDTSENRSQMNKIQSHYELFPSSEKSFGFLTPIKKTSNFSPKYASSTTVSPTSSVSNAPSQLSPSTLRQSLSPISSQSSASFVWQNRNQCSIPEFKVPYNPASCEGTSHDEIKPSKMCMFCRKNGETPTVYMTHCVKEKIGNTFRVTCPILRSHVCTQCGASGDEAHTITYCPILKTINNGKPLKSTTITLKNTRIKSNGKRRY